MTQFQRKRIKEEIDRQNAMVDASADSLLDKLKASKWTGVILVAGIVVFLIASFF